MGDVQPRSAFVPRDAASTQLASAVNPFVGREEVDSQRYDYLEHFHEKGQLGPSDRNEYLAMREAVEEFGARRAYLKPECPSADVRRRIIIFGFDPFTIRFFFKGRSGPTGACLPSQAVQRTGRRGRYVEKPLQFWCPLTLARIWRAPGCREWSCGMVMAVAAAHVLAIDLDIGDAYSARRARDLVALLERYSNRPVFVRVSGGRRNGFLGLHVFVVGVTTEAKLAWAGVVSATSKEPGCGGFEARLNSPIRVPASPSYYLREKTFVVDGEEVPRHVVDDGEVRRWSFEYEGFAEAVTRFAQDPASCEGAGLPPVGTPSVEVPDEPRRRPVLRELEDEIRGLMPQWLRAPNAHLGARLAWVIERSLFLVEVAEDVEREVARIEGSRGTPASKGSPGRSARGESFLEVSSLADEAPRVKSRPIEKARQQIQAHFGQLGERRLVALLSKIPPGQWASNSQASLVAMNAVVATIPDRDRAVTWVMANRHRFPCFARYTVERRAKPWPITERRAEVRVQRDVRKALETGHWEWGASTTGRQRAEQYLALVEAAVRTLKGSQLKVYLACIDLAVDLQVRVGTRVIERRAGLGAPRTVCNALKALEERGYIDRSERGISAQVITLKLEGVRQEMKQVGKNTHFPPGDPSSSSDRVPRILQLLRGLLGSQAFRRGGLTPSDLQVVLGVLLGVDPQALPLPARTRRESDRVLRVEGLVSARGRLLADAALLDRLREIARGRGLDVAAERQRKRHEVEQFDWWRDFVETADDEEDALRIVEGMNPGRADSIREKLQREGKGAA